MMKKCIIIGVVVLFMFSAFEVSAQMRKAEIKKYDGIVLIRKAETGEWIAAYKGMSLSQDDRIRTGVMSGAEIMLGSEEDHSIVSIAENSEVILDELTIDKLTGDKKTMLDVPIGNIMIKAAKLKGESQFEVTTPTSMVGVRGTEFEVDVSAAK